MKRICPGRRVWPVARPKGDSFYPPVMPPVAVTRKTPPVPPRARRHARMADRWRARRPFGRAVVALFDGGRA